MKGEGVDTEKLNAGRALDVLVSEKVMGSPKHRWIEGCGQIDMLGTYEGCEFCDRKRIPERENEVCIRPYSTDIVAAWEVVEKLKWVWNDFSLDWDGEDGCWVVSQKGKTSNMGSAHEAPLAICRAALKARM